jgi:hypothetical protein
MTAALNLHHLLVRLGMIGCLTAVKANYLAGFGE